jgi:hypothetical protein
MINNAFYKTITLHLIRGAVPERADEISKLWEQYGHDVEIAPSTKGLTMNADATRIRFSNKDIDCFWLLGFSLWRSIEAYSPALQMAILCEIPVDHALRKDTDSAFYELNLNQHINASRLLIEAKQTADIAWPPDIPEPTANRHALMKVQDIATFDLVALALTFVILHEFQHVMSCSDTSMRAPLPEEEISCDTYARDFMTSRIAHYAEEHRYNFGDVQQKRAMGIALAAAIIHVMTPTHTRWGNNQYPPISERLMAMVDGYTLKENSSFWAFTACLLIALIRQENRSLNVVAHTNRAMVDALLAQLR